jgi:SAM-dependent methyltransferase
MRGWEQARRVILAGVHRRGDFLDVGCANGLLMESLTSWSAEQGTPLRLHGLEVSDALAQRARESSPALAGRIQIGDVMTWVPPQRFDYVRIELVYAPPGARGTLVLRCLGSLVADGGRLIVCSYRSTGEDNAADLSDTLTDWGHRVAGTAQALGDDGSVMTQVAWIDR